MASEEQNHSSSSSPPKRRGKDHGDAQPEWADGLKQLYDSVVEEELPDSFKDLLAQLDDGDPSDTSQSNVSQSDAS